MSRLTIPEAFLRESHERLWSAPVPWIDVPAGRLDGHDGGEWFAPAPAGAHSRLRVRLLPDVLRSASWRFWRALASPVDAPARVELALFSGRGCAGAVLADGRAAPLDEVWIQGARMETWCPGQPPPGLRDAVTPDGPFSRYAGALGGDEVVDRLRDLPLAVIGVSRLGSLLAVAAAKAGVRSLVLVDADVVETHHLDALEVARPIPGEPKVLAVRRLLGIVAPETRVFAMARPIEDPDALAAALAARVWITAPDRGRPRLLAALAATACHRVHLDVGTAVLDDAGDRRAGADVRLLVPGRGCLLCVGGMDLARRGEVDWRRERAGSLRSLNGLAASVGFGLLERLVAGRRSDSAWMRVELDGGGLPRVEAPGFRPRDGCAICRHAGAGDAAWSDELMSA